MKKILILSGIFIFLCSFIISAVETATLYSIKDNPTNSWRPARNWGGGGNLVVGHNTNQGMINRQLIQFDLSSIPNTADVTGATLYIYRNLREGNCDRTIRAYRLKQSWDEGAGCNPCDTTGSSWSYYIYPNPWPSGDGPAIGNDNSESSDIGSIHITDCNINQWYPIELNSDKIEEWIDNSFVNNGLVLKQDDETGGKLNFFNSRESSNNKPRLIVTYTSPVDTVKPSTTDDYGAKDGEWQNSAQTITLTPNDAAPSSGIEWTKYCVDVANTCDPASGTSYAGPVTISTGGTNYFRYASKDNGGNVQDTVSRTVMIDTAGPTVSVSGAPEDWMVSQSGISAGVSCSNGEAGCDASSYRLIIYSSDPGTCPTDYSSYTLPSPQTITERSYLCAAAKDNVGNAGFSSPADFKVYDAIQAAINAAIGTTVVIAAGTYDEQLIINKNLTLSGANASTTIIRAPVTMNTINVRGGSQAIQGVINVVGATAHGINVNINGLTVDGNYVTPASSSTWFAGIVYSNADGTIENNIITKNKQEILGGDAASWRGHGIWIGDASAVTVNNNEISEWQRNGIEIRDAAATATITNNILTGMDTSPSVPNGITFYGSTGGTASGNTVTGCKYTGTGSGNDFYSGTQASAIMSYDASGTFTFSDNTVTDNDMGIYTRLNSGSTDITGNTVENNLYWGVVFRKGDATVTGNTITGSEIGIFVPNTRADTGTVPVANNNNIYDNTVFGAKNDASYLVNAENNWWGDSSGPSGVGPGTGDAVSTNVDYEPFLKCVASATEDNVLNVPNECSTIRAAIDDANPGDTIYVAAGTYDEQVIINKELILQGNGDTTIIKPSSAAKLISLYTLGTQTGALWNGKKLASIIAVSNANNVIIKDLKLDGESLTSLSAGADYVVGVSYGETGGAISNVKVVNMNQIPESIRTYGIWLDAVSNSVSVEVNNSNIELYNKNGINARGAMLTINIHDNTITDPDGALTQYTNGIGIVSGATGTVAKNTVTDIYAGGTDYTATGIFTYDTSSVVIEDNTISEALTGIALSGTPITGGTSSSTVQRNTVFNCDVGIQLEAPNTSNNIINDNTIHDNEEAFYLNGVDGDGVEYSMGTGNEAHFNNIYTNDFGMKNDNPAVMFNAENNWWGSCDGPGGVGPGNGDDVSINVDYNPWMGICIEDKTNVTCKYKTDDITLSANVSSLLDMDSILVSYTINGVNYNVTATSIGNDIYSTTILSSQLVGSQNITWNVYANDSFGNMYNNSWKEFYVRSRTNLTINPINPDGLNNWYITEPIFTLIKDLVGNKTYYRWNGAGSFVYSIPFGLDNIPNPPKESGGSLELTYWTDFSECGNESEQNSIFKVDLTSPEIKDLNPGEGYIIDVKKPEISALLDDVYQGNSGINVSSVNMSFDNIEITSDINVVNLSSNSTTNIKVRASYTPDGDLADGGHYVNISVKDIAGNPVSEKGWMFYINSTDLWEFNVSSPQNITYNNKKIRINATTSQNVDLKYSIDNKIKNLCNDCSNYDNLKSFDDGWHNLIVKAEDSYGNIKEESFRFFIDSKKPKIIKTLPKKNEYSNGSLLFYVKYTEINYSLENSVRNVTLFYGNESKELSCESGKNKEYTTSVNLNEYNGQKINYYFYIEDNAGNSDTSKITEINVDTTNPVITLNGPVNGTIYGKKIPFDLTINEKVKSLTYTDNYDSKTKDARLCSKCDEYNKTKSFSKGNHSVNVIATDNAGNSYEELVSFEVAY